MLATSEKIRPFAGGTDLMVLFEAGKLLPGDYLNISELSELKGIQNDEKFVTLGALTTFSEVKGNPILQKEFPLLCRAANEVGAIAIQNRATLGGNIANASPAADSSPALLVYEAEVEITSQSHSQWMPYLDFHTGYKQTRLKSNELVTRVRLPRGTAESNQTFRKVGTRAAQAISKVCFAAVASLNGGKLNRIRVAFGSVAPIPLRCLKTEMFLTGKKLDKTTIDLAVKELAREISPIDDLRSTHQYRRVVAGNLLRNFLENLR